MTNLSWFYDVLAIALVVVFLYIGARKGFVKTVLILASYVVALIGGYLISDSLSVTVYDKFVEEKAVELIDENYDKINVSKLIKNQLDSSELGIEISQEDIDAILEKGGDINENISSYLVESGVAMTAEEVKSDILGTIDTKKLMGFVEENVPDELVTMVTEMADTSKETITEVVTVLATGTKDEGVEILSDELVRPVVTGVIRLTIWLIVFVVLLLVLRVVVVIVSKAIDFLPLVGSLNTLLGAVLGVAQGVMVLIVICIAIKLAIIISSGDMMFINEETINATKVFKIIYNLKLLK